LWAISCFSPLALAFSGFDWHLWVVVGSFRSSAMLPLSSVFDGILWSLWAIVGDFWFFCPLLLFLCRFVRVTITLLVVQKGE
jgi:hypothetical protein